MNPMQLPSIPIAPPPPQLPQLSETGNGNEASFKDLLLDGIQQVNSMQQQADVAVQQLMTGDDVDPAVVLTTDPEGRHVVSHDDADPKQTGAGLSGNQGDADLTQLAEGPPVCEPASRPA